MGPGPQRHATAAHIGQRGHAYIGNRGKDWLSGCDDEDFIVYCEIVAEVLGRVVQAELESPRGPDASHRIRVPKDWLEQGAIIELELPRHLTCRACEGGGCDICERSGAVTLLRYA